MSRLLAGGFDTGPGSDHPVRETLRDAALLLGAIGASLVLLLLLSLLPHREAQPLRTPVAAPAAPEAPLPAGQTAARAEHHLPAWHVAAQQ